MEKKSNLDKKKVLLGLSGGVDSTAACLLLKQRGYEVFGYWFDITGESISAGKEAEAVASQLGIELIKEDVSEDFSQKIIKSFCNDYLCGRTPNPCIICNPLIKFRKLAETADRIGAYHIATGHYCRIIHEKNGGYFIEAAVNSKKDQSYMLYRLSQDILKRVIFPLGEFEEKDTVRQLLRNENLENAEKRDSQEICFIDSDDNYADYIKRKGYSSKEGNFIKPDGTVVGRHKGIVNYTIGQRKGLGIALGKPAFVTRIDCEKNEITLGDNEDLFSNVVVSHNNFFTFGKAEDYEGEELYAKVRYSVRPSKMKYRVYDNKIISTFDESQRAATPGQSIVFYKDNKIIGGGFIV